jgi:hypothetical protein
VVDEPVAHVAGAVAHGEELAGLLLTHEGDAERLLEEPALLGERPGAEQLAHAVGRGGGDVSPLVHRRGEDVAAPSPADQDLSAAILRALDDHDLAPPLRGVDRRHETGRPAADHDDRETCISRRSAQPATSSCTRSSTTNSW